MSVMETSSILDGCPKKILFRGLGSQKTIFWDFHLVLTMFPSSLHSFAIIIFTSRNVNNETFVNSVPLYNYVFTSLSCIPERIIQINKYHYQMAA